MGDPVDGVAVTVFLTTGDSVTIVGAPDGSEESSMTGLKQKPHAEAHLSLTT